MFKKSICVLLAVLLVCSITACSGGQQARQNAVTSSISGTAEESTTANAEQGTTAAKDNKKASTSKKQSGKTKKKTSTTAESGKTDNKNSNQNSTGSANGKKTSGGKPQSASKQTTTKKQSTTKKQTTTKKQKQTLAVTFTITCSAAVGRVDGVPESGYFLKGAGVSVSNGANVYEALVKCCEANGVAVVASNTMYGMYVSSIGGLAEFEAGKMSGWTYTVNGNYPPKACDKYVLSDGDKVEFIYKAG